MNLDPTQLFALAVRWFATGDRELCEGMTKLIGGVHQPQPFDASLAGWGLSGNQMIVLCHKAVGYMLSGADRGRFLRCCGAQGGRQGLRSPSSSSSFCSRF